MARNTRGRTAGNRSQTADVQPWKKLVWGSCSRTSGETARMLNRLAAGGGFVDDLDAQNQRYGDDGIAAASQALEPQRA
jgi:hypothetical protein